MLLIIDSSLPTLAQALHSEASTSFDYDPKPPYGSDLGRFDLTDVEITDLTVIIVDTSEIKNSPDYRRIVLDVMAKGGVIVVPEDAEVDPSISIEIKYTGTPEQLENLIVASRYAESRAQFFAEKYPKVKYVGPTYEDPMAVIILPHKDDFSSDIKKEIVNSLPEDFWGYVAFISAQRKESIGKLLDYLEFSAVLVLDKKMDKRVESLDRPVHVIGTPDGTEEYGKYIRNLVKTQE